MKKVLSLVLSAVMLLTMVFTMSGMQAFAADDINLIDTSKIVQNDSTDGYYEILDNGGIKIVATGADGYGVSFKLDQAFSVMDLPYLQLDVSSTGRFNIAFNVTNKSGNGWPQLLTDWYPAFQETAPTGNGIDPISDFHQSLDFQGYYTYGDNTNMPADGTSTIILFAVALKEPGELILNHLTLSAEEEFTVAEGSATTAAADGEATTAAPAGDTATTTAATSAKTGEDTTLLFMMAAAMVVAGGVVTLTVRTKKAK